MKQTRHIASRNRLIVLAVLSVVHLHAGRAVPLLRKLAKLRNRNSSTGTSHLPAAERAKSGRRLACRLTSGLTRLIRLRLIRRLTKLTAASRLTKLTGARLTKLTGARLNTQLAQVHPSAQRCGTGRVDLEELG